MQYKSVRELKVLNQRSYSINVHGKCIQVYLGKLLVGMAGVTEGGASLRNNTFGEGWTFYLFFVSRERVCLFGVQVSFL